MRYTNENGDKKEIGFMPVTGEIYAASTPKDNWGKDWKIQKIVAWKTKIWMESGEENPDCSLIPITENQTSDSLNEINIDESITENSGYKFIPYEVCFIGSKKQAEDWIINQAPLIKKDEYHKKQDRKLHEDAFANIKKH